MENLKLRFEKDLKAKLLLKSSGHIQEDLLLLKAFRYCDSKETGKCDQDTFAQSLTKVGFYGYTDNELDKLFLLYSNNKPYLDYKKFVGIVFNNPSLMNEEEENKNEENDEEEQNEENEEQDLIEKIILGLIFLNLIGYDWCDKKLGKLDLWGLTFLHLIGIRKYILFL